MPTSNKHVRAGIEQFFVGIASIAGTVPADVLQKKEEYQVLLVGLADSLNAGRITPQQALYELRQLKNGLIQAIGSIGLDLFGKRKAVLNSAIVTGLEILLRIAMVQ